MARELIKGNIAFAETALRVGLQAYFGYPITPQTEALEWLSHRMPELGRTFVQAESEVAAINMVLGAACTGVRVMTSSSSPGVSLMQEGLSYIAGLEAPMVLVDVMRGGPGLGNIAPAQGDYNQMVHGGGHGDYHPIVLAPASVQELVDYTDLAFDLAEKYRSIVVLLFDGTIGQMMEPAELPAMRPLKKTYPDWAVRGEPHRPRRLMTSVHMQDVENEDFNLMILKRWQDVESQEIRYREYFLDDAKFLVVGFGTAGRVALSAVRAARAEGIPVGLLRPITLSPFPNQLLESLVQQVEGILVVEMNTGQMLNDIVVRAKSNAAVEFYGRPGGIIPTPDEILPEIHRLAKGPRTTEGHPRDRWLERMLAKRQDTRR